MLWCRTTRYEENPSLSSSFLCYLHRIYMCSSISPHKDDHKTGLVVNASEVISPRIHVVTLMPLALWIKISKWSSLLPVIVPNISCLSHDYAAPSLVSSLGFAIFNPLRSKLVIAKGLKRLRTWTNSYDDPRKTHVKWVTDYFKWNVRELEPQNIAKQYVTTWKL